MKSEDLIAKGEDMYRELMADIGDIKADILKRYKDICQLYDSDPAEPKLKVRLAEYFRGIYFMRIDNHIQAENAFKEALKAEAPKETYQLLPDTKILCNLLILYYSEYNIKAATQLLRELMDAIQNGNHGLSQKECWDIYTINNDLGEHTPESLVQLKNKLFQILKDLKQSKESLRDSYGALANFVGTSALLFSKLNCASQLEYKICWEILRHIYEVYFLHVEQKIFIYRVFATLAVKLNLKEESYIAECVKLAENDSSDRVKAEVYQAAASFYYGIKKYHKSIEYLELSLSAITREWNDCVRYLDQRAYKILQPLQDHFLGCYDTIRKCMDIPAAYEKILQFKALASLTCRKRNKILYDNRCNKHLVDEILKFQDKIAYLETEKILRRKIVDYEKELILFRNLESDFARQFPKDVPFIHITLENVLKAIPDNSAVIEYFFYETNYEIHEFTPLPNNRTTVIDIYITRKIKGNCSIKRIMVPDGNRILEKARGFLRMLQEEEKSEKRISFRNELYQELVKPLFPYIKNIKQLYIAPDQELINLPLENLADSKNESLENFHDIIKIECARDFLFYNKECQNSKGSLVIGNPQYEIAEKESCDTSFPLIPQLPFSEVEAETVSRYCGCECYSGSSATKSLLLSARGVRNIHIATHGAFNNDNPMYSSCLLFAGAKNWMRSGKQHEFYGNGILTADEISRIDLHSVELVVVSTCHSGMNKVINNKVFHGLIEAFSAAGVHYIISHLWAANDFSTAILMDYFYFQYIHKNQSPDIALKLAKQYLRTLTSGELKKHKLYGLLRNNDTKSKEYYEDDYCLFKDELFWGGFSCYRCN